MYFFCPSVSFVFACPSSRTAVATDLMTSFAFILGVLPLYFASGAGKLGRLNREATFPMGYFSGEKIITINHKVPQTFGFENG